MSNIELSQVKELVLSETGSFFSILKQIPEIVHTKYGSQIAMIVLGASSAKERKVILKSLKPYVKKIAEDSNGWLVLARVFDCVDDTVLVKNCVLNELVDGKLLPELMTNSNVCNLFLYLLAGQSTKYFSPDLIKILNVSSGFIASTSKKSADARKGELMASVVPRFLSELSGQSSALAAALTNWKSGLLLCELLGSSVAKANAGEANKIVDLMAKLSSSLTEVEVGQDVVVFNQNFPRILKRLLELPSAADVFGQHLLSKGFLERLFENCANSPPEPFYAIGHLVKTLESPQVEEIAKLFTKLCPDAKETQNQGIKKLAEQLKLQVQ